MYIQYIEKTFRAETEKLIEQSNSIIEEYGAQGFDLTLRQLYYQLVSRDIIPNKQSQYKRLGSIISSARRAGLVRWDAIVDRTRNLQSNTHWASPEEIMKSAIATYKIDKWTNQDYRPEVWIEKDALVGVIARVCQRLYVPYFSCRGYSSDSEMWEAGSNRFRLYAQNGQIPIVIHLGDHDPSGVDMSRDIVDRLEMFSGLEVEVVRAALNIEQVQKYNPPPNPTKLTDSRAKGYVLQYGNSSWELDALEPSVLASLIEDEIDELRDDRLWDEKVEEEKGHIKRLREMIKGGSGAS